MDDESPTLPPPRLDEYDVVIPKAVDDYNGGGGQFRIQYTKEGNTIFWDYKRLKDGSKGPAERFQWFRNRGDVFLYVDGVSTSDKSFQQVMELMRKSWSERSFSCFRMKNIKYAAEQEKEMEVSLERKLETLSKELAVEEEQMAKKQQEIFELETQLERKKQEVRVHKQEVSKRKLEMRKLSREELKKRQEQVLLLQRQLAAVESDEDGNENNVGAGQEPVFDTSLMTMMKAIPPPSTPDTSPSSTLSNDQPLLALECNPSSLGQAAEEEPLLHAQTGLTRAAAVSHENNGVGTSSSSASEEAKEEQNQGGNSNNSNITATVDAAVAYLVRDASGHARDSSQPLSAEHFVFEQVGTTNNENQNSNENGDSNNNGDNNNNKKNRTLLCPRPSLFSKRNKAAATSTAATSARSSNKGTNIV